MAGFVKPDLFKISVRALIQDSDKVLLAKKAFGERGLRGVWETPGGKLKEGESVFDCLKREVEEETGYEAHPEEILDFVVGRKPEHNVSRLHLIFKCRLDYGKKAKIKEGVKIKCFTLKELKKMVEERQTDWHDEKVFTQITQIPK